MDTGRLDHWLKRLWLVNGIALLVLFAAGVVATLYGLWSTNRERSAVVAGAGALAEPSDRDPRAVRFGLPNQIMGSSTQIILVRYGKDFAAKGASPAKVYGSYDDSYEGDDDGPAVNVLFLTPGQPGRALVDRPAYVGKVRYPRSKDDSLRHWIEYEIAVDDRNHDGRLDESDGPALWVSELNGTRLTRVLPPGYRFWRSDPQPDGRTLRIAAFVEQAGDKKLAESEQPERSFIYDVASRRLQPDTMLDSLAGAAARIVGRRAPP